MSMTERIGVIGATSPVGKQILETLTSSGHSVLALSRSIGDGIEGPIEWLQVKPEHDLHQLAERVGLVHRWIIVSHIWVANDYLPMLERCQAKKIVCISSTSRFTKTQSSNPYEEALVQRLQEGESGIQQWGDAGGVAWTILRPTLIYGRSTDRNLSEIVKLIKKWGFFPMFGQGNGLRQPIYVDDVAKACIQALNSSNAGNKAYNISGAEQLTYREMVARMFRALGKEPRFLSIPLPLFSLALVFLRKIPRYRNWNADMVLRMNRDMVFDHEAASRDFDFRPQKFLLKDRDVQ